MSLGGVQQLPAEPFAAVVGVDDERDLPPPSAGYLKDHVERGHTHQSAVHVDADQGARRVVQPVVQAAFDVGRRGRITELGQEVGQPRRVRPDHRPHRRRHARQCRASAGSGAVPSRYGERIIATGVGNRALISPNVRGRAAARRLARTEVKR